MWLDVYSEDPAIISAEDHVEKNSQMPETVVACFENKLINEFLKTHKCEVIGECGVACKRHLVYKFNYKGKNIAIVQAGVGAPYCVGIFEEVVAMGAKNILVFGSCGVLKDLKESSIIIPTSSIRGEGTSYYYAPPSEEIVLNPKYVQRLVDFCNKSGIDFTIGKNWTTDAFYRETKELVNERINQGAITVDMECSAMAAFAQFRGVNFSEFFYAADSLAKEKWEVRNLKDKKSLTGEEKALELALECVLTLFDE